MTDRTHTAASVAARLTEAIEPPTAEQLLAIVQRLDGQPITTRLLDKLPGGRVEWRLQKDGALGYIEIRNRAYRQSDGKAPGSVLLVLAKSEAPTLSAAWVERENPSYFAARRQRNALRAAALANPAGLAQAAADMNEAQQLRARLAAVRARLALVCPPDQYQLERACGLREE